MPRLKHTVGPGFFGSNVLSIADGKPRPGSGPISQQEIVELQLLETKIKKGKLELGGLVAQRNAMRESLTQRLLDGAQIEEGPHTILIKKAIRNSITLLLLPFVLWVSLSFRFHIPYRPMPKKVRRRFSLMAEPGIHLPVRSNFGPKLTVYLPEVTFVAA